MRQQFQAASTNNSCSKFIPASNLMYLRAYAFLVGIYTKLSLLRKRFVNLERTVHPVRVAVSFSHRVVPVRHQT